MAKEVQARILLENPLLDELVEAYKYSLFEQWQAEPDQEGREQLFAKAVMANDLSYWIDNKCRDLIDGTSTS
jgi:hypothetical protein